MLWDIMCSLWWWWGWCLFLACKDLGRMLKYSLPVSPPPPPTSFFFVFCCSAYENENLIEVSSSVSLQRGAVLICHPASQCGYVSNYYQSDNIGTDLPCPPAHLFNTLPHVKVPMKVTSKLSHNNPSVWYKWEARMHTCLCEHCTQSPQ